MSKKTFYLQVKDLVETGVKEIQHFSLWNNQVDNEANEKQEFPINYPACFFEFKQLDWSDFNGVCQQSDSQFSIRVVVEDYKHNPYDYLDLVDKVFSSLQGKETCVSKAIKRISEFQDTDHGNLIIWEITFHAVIYDSSAQDAKNTTTLQLDPSYLNLSTTLDIDNDVIRSGDGEV